MQSDDGKKSRRMGGNRKSGPTAAVFGTIKNPGASPWKAPYFHVDFFNSDGKLVDSELVGEYECYLPANEHHAILVENPGRSSG
ncbi:MAG: hypothetical protein KGR98_09545, partial [Verrucomicrobia bacterium]|nr:hypothetical protein [Verrucomicrobiota bacterium]